jgi:FAD/FMN-containing dehydrogenase
MHRRDFLSKTSAAIVAAPWVLARRTAAIPPCPGRITDADLDALRASLDGTLVLPTDAAYATARLAYQRRHVAAPMAVVRAATTEDVVATVGFARDRGIHLFPRGGGHSYVGASVGDGIILDLAGLDAIEFPAEDRVRTGAGARLGSIYARLYCERGLDLPSGSCDSVGIVGVALGGGYGLESRSHGLTADRLRSATMVRADGEVVVADARSNPSLFWALRGGGGGAFGVVTALEFEPTVWQQRWRTQVVYSWADAEAAFLAWEQFVASDPDASILTVSNVTTSGSWKTPRFRVLVQSSAGSAGTLAIAQATIPKGVQPLAITTSALAAPSCPGSVASGSAYGKYKSAMPEHPVGAAGFAVVKSWFDARWSDPDIPRTETAQLLFDAYGGAIRQVPPTATAFVHREALYSAQFITWWKATTPPATVDRHLQWIRGLYADARPHFGNGCYANYCDEDLVDWPTAYWGANLPALQQVKAAYDPEGFFRGRHTVPLPGKA